MNEWTRFGANSPIPARLRSRRRPVIWLFVGVLLMVGALRLIGEHKPGAAGVIGFAGGVTILVQTGKLISRTRTLRGRPRLAARRGWTYRSEDAALPASTRLEQFLRDAPPAFAVLTGTENGVPFVVFDQTRDIGGHDTFYLARLPRPLPVGRVSIADGQLIGGDIGTPEVAALFTRELLQRIEEALPGCGYVVTGEWVNTPVTALLSPRPREIEQRIDAMTRVAALLSDAADELTSAG
ncbi:hypothetical protein [Actinoplanes sp. NPDC026670]|uniref:hypothetical protein n=1 Tax=Actinoplanes sp. NPDC026670 TaxID=3154700 RepID=UPI0033F33E72